MINFIYHLALKVVGGPGWKDHVIAKSFDD
jgi:hypothetical protein